VAVLPMFPLGSVLLPTAVLPLHVFEPRYRQLVRDCVDAPEHEFGVVLIDRGSEVGGGDLRRDIGVVARMLQVAELDDGRYAVMAVGTRRIRVIRWLDDDPYPRAEVEDWPDDHQQVDESVLEEVSAATRRCRALAVEMGELSSSDDEISDDSLVASYQLTALAPLGPQDHYALLAAAGPVDRLDALRTALSDAQELLMFRLGDAAGG
jgi:Lon protease-like protein